jgi:hypothetical protein
MKKPWYAALLAVFGIACASPAVFVDTTVAGLTNLTWFGPDIWTVAHPMDDAAWQSLKDVVSKWNKPVLFVQLHDDVEGDDAAPTQKLGWELLKKPLPPEDDKPWTVLVLPKPEDVNAVLDAIQAAHAAGKVVVFGCVHARDRTGLIRALLGMRMYGWSKEYAWNQMIMHGFRWELPDLDVYFAEYAAKQKK